MQGEPAGDETALSKVWKNMGFQRKFWQTVRLIVPGFWVTRLIVALVVAAVVSTSAAVLASGLTTWWFKPPAIPQKAFLTSDEMPEWKSRSQSYVIRRDSLNVEDSNILFKLGMLLDSTQPVDPNVSLRPDPLPAPIRRRYDLWWARLNERFAGAGIMVYLTVIEAGFPFRSVEGGVIWGAPPKVAKFWVSDFPRLRLLSGDPNGFVVYGPLWWGLTGNTLCWGLPLFAVLSLIERQRGRYYAKFGLCEKCNYESVALAKCPECGTPGECAVRAGSQT